jgi:uncharacterized protein (DUF885 family)
MKTIMFHGSPGRNLLIAGLTVLLLIVGCGKTEPTVTPMPPSATPTKVPPRTTAVPLSATPPPTLQAELQDETASPTHTPVPPTAVPTNTPIPPTPSATVTPTPVPLFSFEKSAQTFSAPATFQVGLGDFDGDGDLDAAMANLASEAQVWLNDGQGVFTDSGQRLTSQGHGIGVGDLDGDGDLDLFITCAQMGAGGLKASQVYLNDGQGMFRENGQDLGDAALSGNGLNLVDVDGDGDLDVHVVYYEVGGMPDKVYLNDGRGTFSDSGLALSEEVIAWGDLDADGDVDILGKVLGEGYKTLLNDGTGQFVGAWRLQDSRVTYGEVALGDLDSDGDLDALIANGSDEQDSLPTMLLWNDGAGQFSDSGQRLNETIWATFALGDLDQDGDLDVYVSNVYLPNQVWLNDGSGHLLDSGLRMEGSPGSMTVNPSLGDLDGDGDLDVFLGSFRGGAEIWFNTGATSSPAEAVPDQPSIAEIIAGLQGLPIDQFFEQSHVQLQLRDPDNLISNGLAEEYGVAHNDRFSDISDTYVRETQQLETAILDLLRAYDRSVLSPEQQLSYDIYEWTLDDLVRGHEFTYYGYPVNSAGLWSLPSWLVSLMTDMPIAGKSDAEDYVARLSQVDTWVEQLLVGLELRQEAGVVPPRYVIQGTIPQIEGYIQTSGGTRLDPGASDLYTSFRDRLEQVDEISAQERQALLEAAQVEIEETFMPAFTELRDYLARLESVASDALGVGQFPRGEDFYDYTLRHWTSTDISADQVHELGLAEVARIQAEMRAVAVEMGYPADISMAAMDQLVAESDVLQGEELRQAYERLIAQARQAAPEFFDLFPSADVVVEYDPYAPPAYYQQPPHDGSGPGRMIVNLVNSAQFIFYNVYTLTHHETIPGHHVQYALAEELDLPKFRRDTLFDVARQFFAYQAFTDGWALYAQRLAWEMGLYGDDLLGNLGRLRQELHVTARLVVDTGIHAQGWSLQGAIAYLEEATGLSYGPNRLRQIINLPGQACGYNVGYFKILELRQRAMDRLGDQFDIKAFHNVILGHGPMPLQILERVVDDWIETLESF